jgi:hypothetical protein
MSNADQIAQEARAQLDTLNALKKTLPITHPLITRTAAAYVELFHAFQKAKYGRIRRRISSASLLR